MYNHVQGCLARRPGSQVEEEVPDGDGGARKARRCVYAPLSLRATTHASSDEVIAAGAASSPEGLLDQRIDSPDVDWAAVHAFYRSCLNSLCQLYGLPGDVFLSNLESELTAPGRPVGVPPRSQP